MSMDVSEKSVQQDMSYGERRKILVVSADHRFRNELVKYAVHLAERMDYGILAINVNTKKLRGSFEMACEPAWLRLRAYAEKFGVHCEHRVVEEPVQEAMDAIVFRARRIGMIVTDTDIMDHLGGWNLSIPVVNVVTDAHKKKGEITMTDQSPQPRKKHWVPVVGFGLATAAVYAAVFMNADTVMSYFTRGGWYAALPIATAFVVSYVHGSFASSLWSLLGIEAMRKDALRKTEQAVIAKKQKIAKRPRAYAHINPFHNM